MINSAHSVQRGRNPAIDAWFISARISGLAWACHRWLAILMSYLSLLTSGRWHYSVMLDGVDWLVNLSSWLRGQHASHHTLPVRQSLHIRVVMWTQPSNSTIATINSFPRLLVVVVVVFAVFFIIFFFTEYIILLLLCHAWQWQKRWLANVTVVTSFQVASSVKIYFLFVALKPAIRT